MPKKIPGGYKPDSVLCTNIGFDGSDVIWRCDADMPIKYKFGRTTISCEGYFSKDDRCV